MVLNIFDADNEKRLNDSLKQSLKLLEDDYLGGHGSRGYGQIEIQNLKFEDRDKSFYEANAQ
jgi:CRISPR-associated protein Csm3